MLEWIKNVFKRTQINNTDIYDSTVNITVWLSSARFKISPDWLKSVRLKHYHQETAAKYIPQLHESHDFDQRHLQDILDFKAWRESGMRRILAAKEEMDMFNQQYELLYAIKNNEELVFAEPEHEVLIKSRNLKHTLTKLYKLLSEKEKSFQLPGYKILEQQDAFATLEQPIQELYPQNTVSLNHVFIGKAPSEQFVIVDLIRVYNQVRNTIERLNQWLEINEQHRNHKIIHGIAGTGKTHTTVHLVEQLTANGDHVIFLNAKSFNGDNVNFEERIHQLLDIPYGLRFGTILKKLNTFARKKGQRIFFIIDALNETTKENLGFSDIWNLNLKQFISAVRTYPNLYLVCTLRTSYLSSIWESIPPGAAELKYISRHENLRSMCDKYFNYYRITVSNITHADLSYFSVPLLLDLYCKLVNEDRKQPTTISLDVHSYMQVFEGYVEWLIREVQQKRQLAARQPIETGLSISSDRFMNNIGGTISVDEFVLSFDQPNTKKSDSIAEPMLEGYLLFIRDRITSKQEIVKHTQQQIGGYLLAIRLAERFPILADLIATKEFSEQINGANPDLHHQLRLDILQFLIQLKPEIVDHLSEEHAFEEGWWYLFNIDGEVPDTAESLLANPLSLSVLPFIMAAGAKKVFEPEHPYNFKFILHLLEKYDSWDFDFNWAYYLYHNADELFDQVDDRLAKLKSQKTDPDTEKLIALYIALINATTVRALRDLATLYLLEYGIEYPLELLQIAKRTVTLRDIYVYERVVQSIYGAVLNLQHDQQFIQEDLPVLARELFQMQFSKTATNPVFNYIVIDSIKHLLDFAEWMGVWTAEDTDLENIELYRSPALPVWEEPTNAQFQSVLKSDERDPPEPIGMDFAIYTIPRLLDPENYKLRTGAVANVLKRVYELGYREDTIRKEDSDQLKAFAFGHNVSYPGKVDRIGKKYNWKAYFDYAGVLLQRGQLNSYYEFGKPETGYQRLSDVGIDISNPSREFEIDQRIYKENLIDKPESPEKWTSEIKIETIEPYFLANFDGQDYIMLKGFVEQIVGGFESRSFIMAETCFIEKNDDLDELKNVVCTKVFDWDRDLHLSPSYDTNVYFGEYYFADNQIQTDPESYSIKTGETMTIKRRVTPAHVLDGHFKAEEINEMRDMQVDKYLHFSGEATLIQYLNESDSEIFKSYSRYIPTVNMGQALGLKSDPQTGLILDAELNKMLVTVKHKEIEFKNEFTYIRADLLKAYMEAEDFALLYQNKQHSYAKNIDNRRFMKYAVIE